MANLNAAHLEAIDVAARHRQRQSLLGLSAFDRHKRFVHELSTFYGGKLPSQPPAAPVHTDFDALREGYRFIRSEEDDASDTWEVRLAKRYYSRLYREYAIADLSRHKEGRVGLRWRTQGEVVGGKGQFSCGEKKCDERRGLASFEVPFGYEEAGERKQALVKVRVCPQHTYELNYTKNKEAEKKQRKRQAAEKKEKEGNEKEEDRGGKKPRHDKKARESDSKHGHGHDDSQKMEEHGASARPDPAVEHKQQQQEGNSGSRERAEEEDKDQVLFAGLFE